MADDPLDNTIDVNLSFTEGTHLESFVSMLGTMQKDMSSTLDGMKDLATQFKEVAESPYLKQTADSLKEATESLKGIAANTANTARPEATPSRDPRAAPETPTSLPAPIVDTNQHNVPANRLEAVATAARGALHGQGLHSGVRLGLDLRAIKESRANAEAQQQGYTAGPDGIEPNYVNIPKNNVAPQRTVRDVLRSATATGDGPGPKERISDALHAMVGVPKNYGRPEENPEAPGPGPGGSGGDGPPTPPHVLNPQNILAGAQTMYLHHSAKLMNQGNQDQARSYLGNEQGYSTAGGEVNIPGTNVGFRLPLLNPASQQELKENISKRAYGIQSGINKQQRDQIYNAADSLGYQYGTKKWGTMRDGLGSLMKSDSAVASSEYAQNRLDVANRTGSQPVDEVVSQLHDMGDAIKGTSVSFRQLSADSSALRERFASVGGTPDRAEKMATNWVRSTGMPAADMGPILDSPLFKANAMTQGQGYLPTEVGLRGDRNNVDALKTFRQVAHMMPGQAKYEMRNGERIQVASKTEDQAARMQMMFPNMPITQIEQLLKHSKQMQAGSQAETDIRGIAQKMGEVKGGHKAQEAEAKRRLGGHNTKDNITTIGDIVHNLRKSNTFTDADVKAVYNTDAGDKGKGKTQQQILMARRKKILDLEKSHAQNYGGHQNNPIKNGKVEFGLTRQAAKLLKVNHSNASQAKENANSGSGTVNDAFGAAKSALGF